MSSSENQYRESVIKTQKLLILRFLADQVGGTDNVHTLALAVTQAFSALSSLQAETLLTEMESQRLVTLRRTSVTVMATITPYGHEVVDGQAKAPGVADPSKVLR